MIISVEGLDGVGKTSLVASLSKKLEMSTICKPINSLLDFGDEEAESIKCKIYKNYSTNIQAMYYLLGYLSALELGEKNNYILDRGFISTYYFSYCKENEKLFDFFAYTYGFPNLTILLYASIEERIKRIMSRDSFDIDLKRDRIYKDSYDKYFEAIKKYHIPHIAINTEKFNESEVATIATGIAKDFLYKQDKNILDIFNINHINDNYEELEKYKTKKL